MRWILANDPNYGVMLIAILAGITALLRSSAVHGLHPLPGFVGLHPVLDSVIAYGIGATPSVPMLVATIAIAGALFGVLAVYLGALLLWLIGLIAGGRGRYRDVRAALAWAFVPYSWLLPFWIAGVLIFGAELRVSGFSYSAFLPSLDSWVLLALVVVDYGTRLFCLVQLVMKLSVAHRCTIWQAGVCTAIASIPLAYAVARFNAAGF